MGLSLGELAVQQSHEVVAWDPDESAWQSAPKAGMSDVDELDDVPGELSAPREVLMWMPHWILKAYRDLDWPAAKSVALLRNQYGGHPIHRADDAEARR